MYKGYNLNLSSKDLISLGYMIDEDTRRKIEEEKLKFGKNIGKKILKSIDTYIDGEKSIDATSLINQWFPPIEADVFISHSHKDSDLAIHLAAWLKEKFGITAFIDSTLWGFSNELLKDIDDKYCYDKRKSTYDYNLRNFTTSHVHLMLSTALSEMIDKTECLFFLNTPESISLENSVIDKTKSAWIYHELVTSKIVKKTYPRDREMSIKYFAESKRAVPDFLYEVDLIHLETINKDDLSDWYCDIKTGDSKAASLQAYGSIPHPLDYLYFNLTENK